MKNFSLRSLFWVTLCAGALQLAGCKKDRTPTETTETTTTQSVPAPEPVVISADDDLSADVKDAVKDFPSVNATVSDGEVTLTGNISRDRLPALMSGLHALNPKKITNNLTVNK